MLTIRNKPLRVTITIWLLLGAVVVLFLYGAYGLARTFDAADKARAQAIFSNDIMYELRVIYRAAVNAETGQRGYILLEDPAYLDPYLVAKEEYGPAIADLRAKLSEPGQTELQLQVLDELASLINNKFNDIEFTIDMVQNGRKAEAIEVLNTGSGQAIMESIRDLIADLNAEERRLLNEAVAEGGRVQQETKQLLIGLSVLVFALIGIVFFLGSRAVKYANAQVYIQEVEAAKSQTELVHRELAHRVKNLFAIVLSIVRSTGREEADGATASGKIYERILALSRAHDLTSDINAQEGSDLKDLINAVLSPYPGESQSLELSGPLVMVPAKSVTPIGLIVHELATNAMKYGAWSGGSDGKVLLHWTIEPLAEEEGIEICLEWQEQGGPALSGEAPESMGFGSRMIRMCAMQMNGTVEKDWQNKGLSAKITIRV